MALKSKIEWTEATWNPVTGCSKLSEGCANCYAERLAKRLRAMGNPRYKNGFEITLHHDLVDLPLRWKEPKFIFVNSMSDLFHEKIPVSFIKKVFKTIQSAPEHIFQILTKRSSRLAELAGDLYGPENLWMGVTIESERVIKRVSDLKSTAAHVKFLSLEPLLSAVDHLSTEGIDWIVVGGESGPGCRAMKPEWVRSIRDKCLRNDIPFFFKQWGGTRKNLSGKVLDGKIWIQMPLTERVK